MKVTTSVEGWDLVRFEGDEEIRVRDLDLGERAGLSRERDIRQTIKKHADAGNINPFAVCAPRPQTSEGGRPATEFWLTEADALFVVTQLNTPQSVALTKEMIRVFMLARRGMLPGQNVDALAAVVALGKQITAIGDAMLAFASRLERVESLVANDTGIVGDAWAEENVTKRLRRIANIWAGDQPASKMTKPAKSHWRSIRNQIQNKFGFGGRGSYWKNFPKGPMVRLLIAELDAYEADAIETGRNRPDPRQVPLRSVK